MWTYAQLAAGRVLSVARQWLTTLGRTFRGFWRYLQTTFALTAAQATDLAYRARQAIQAAYRHGIDQPSGSILSPGSIPIFSSFPRGPSALDRVVYEVTVTWTHPDFDAPQTRQVDIHSGGPLTNLELDQRLQQELPRWLAERDTLLLGEPEEGPTITDWRAWAVVAYRPI